MRIVFFFRFCGNMPFKSKDEDTLYDLIKKGELDFSDEVWNEVSSQGMLCLSISIRVRTGLKST